MPDRLQITPQNRLILTSLGILLIFILGLLVVISAYPLLLAPAIPELPKTTPLPTDTATITWTPTATLTPTITRTRRPTLTPTVTPTPTKTPTPTRTPFPAGPPTLTPALPLPNDNLYNLQNWTPEQADFLVEMMEGYPNTLAQPTPGVLSSGYFQAFHYARTALEEALLRFPDAEQAARWNWQLALTLARLGEAQAGEAYASLIAQGLNSGLTEVADLPSWFSEYEPQLQLRMQELPTGKGSLSSWLVEISGAGSAFVLLRETPAGYQPAVLLSAFDFLQRPTYTAFTSELTGDEIAEVILFPVQPSVGTTLEAPLVYSLMDGAPQALPFDPSALPIALGTDFANRWQATPNPDGGNDLQFAASVFPSCPVEIQMIFRWNGQEFAAVGQDFRVQPNPGTLAHCRFVIEHAANAWGPRITAELMAALAPVWPPATNEQGKPFAADAGDEWSYRLGVAYALAGEAENARTALQELVENPKTNDSQWALFAQRFLTAYRSPGDIYRACIQAEYCDPRQALQNLVAAMSPQEYPAALTALWQAGVAQRTAGYYDFDGDEVKETWFTVRHRPGEKLELWILVPYRDGVKAFFITAVDTNLPKLSNYIEGETPPIVLVDSSSPFQVRRLPQSREPYLTRPSLPQVYPNRFQEGVKAARVALFAREEPSLVLKQLQELQKFPGLLCRASWSCDEYEYLLGLASELAKQPRIAIEAYLRLWRNYSRSPYTTMARLKLAGIQILPSATPTTTLAGTTTPTITGTPPTATATLAATPTGVSPTPTATVTSAPPTPYPMPNPTATYPYP